MRANGVYFELYGAFWMSFAIAHSSLKSIHCQWRINSKQTNKEKKIAKLCEHQTAREHHSITSIQLVSIEKQKKHPKMFFYTLLKFEYLKNNNNNDDYMVWFIAMATACVLNALERMISGAKGYVKKSCRKTVTMLKFDEMQLKRNKITYTTNDGQN